MKRVKRQWARVRFTPYAERMRELRERPLIFYRKGLISPEELQLLYPTGEK